MTGTWIGKTRSLSLWSHINDYVTAYESAHTTAIDKSWFKRWKELIDVHNITREGHIRLGRIELGFGLGKPQRKLAYSNIKFPLDPDSIKFFILLSSHTRSTTYIRTAHKYTNS